MRTRLSHPRSMLAGGAALALLTGVALASPATAATAGTPVGGGQYFAGWVGPLTSTGADPSPVIDVVCPGPVTFGQTGYPAADQDLTIAQVAASTSGAGYTGAGADRIAASAIGLTATELLATFTSYGTQQIPTNVLLPCRGTGRVVFEANGSGATPAVEAVTFRPVCGTQVCAQERRR